MAKSRGHLEAPATYEQAILFKPYIYITQLVIEMSIRRNRFLCMVTRAIANSIPGAVRIRADRHMISFSVGLWRYVFATPSGVALRVVRYDKGGAVRPWQFRLQGAAVKPVLSTKRLSTKPRRKYTLTGKYKGKFKCGRWSSTRWAGVKKAA